MFLDRELEDILAAKARLVERSDIRRQTIVLEVCALRARVRRAFSWVSLGMGAAEQALAYLRSRKGC